MTEQRRGGGGGINLLQAEVASQAKMSAQGCAGKAGGWDALSEPCSARLLVLELLSTEGGGESMADQNSLEIPGERPGSVPSAQISLTHREGVVASKLQALVEQDFNKGGAHMCTCMCV